MTQALPKLNADIPVLAETEHLKELYFPFSFSTSLLVLSVIIVVTRGEIDPMKVEKKQQKIPLQMG
ncbi:MAG: hypothetical protein R3Y63_07190 [Eubacteriales bacterium]